MVLPSKLAIGEIAYFQPDLRKIKLARDRDTQMTRYLLDDTATAVKIVGVSFTESKVYYDFVVPNGDGTFYNASPLRRVDSVMVLDKSAREPKGDNEDVEDGWWHEG